MFSEFEKNEASALALFFRGCNQSNLSSNTIYDEIKKKKLKKCYFLLIKAVKYNTNILSNL